MSNIKITEQFLTIQGEGRSVGQTAYFIRLAGCNLWCKWCDSMHSVDPHLYHGVTTDINYSAIPKNCTLAVITGGEPTLFDLKKIRAELLKINPQMRIEIESNATQFPVEYVSVFFWNLSPKLSSSQQKLPVQDQLRLVQLPAWSEFAQKNPERVIFKFVITQKKDLAEVDALIELYNIPKNLVYLMAEGQTQESQSLEKTEFVINHAKTNGYNFSPRLHVMYWGAKRGI